MKPYPPFTVVSDDEGISIQIAVDDSDVLKPYNEIFERNGVLPNGYAWEDLIDFVLERLNLAVYDEMTFDSEEGVFVAYPESEQDGKKFFETLRPVFKDLKKFEDWLKKMNLEIVG